MFVFGAGLALAVIPLVCLCLPESLGFLLAHRPPRVLQWINVLVRRLGHAALAELPSPPGGRAEHGNRLARLLCVAQRRTTLLLWALFFLVMFGFYFIMSWTPKLLVAAGLSTAQGITSGTLPSIGGIFGVASLGGLTAHFRLERVLALFMLLTAALLALFSLSAGLSGAALSLGLLIGFCANACVVGLYALAPSLYDAPVRATGAGWGIGVGHGGAILSSLAVRLLLDDGWQPLPLYGAFATVFVATAAVLPLLGARRRERSPMLGDVA